METQVELKGAQTRLERARSELRDTVQLKADIDERIVVARAKVRQLEDELKKIKLAPIIIVSEHALLRYMERVMGVDIEHVKQKILTTDVVNAIGHFHAGSIPHADGYTLRVRENTVTTVVTEKEGSF